MRDVLISGNSIAGPTLAYWLGRHGFRVSLLEKAPAVRPGGQAVDVRGAALEVLSRMNLLDDARELRTEMKGVSLVDADGVELWRSEEGTLSGGSFAGGDIEILRDDLSSLLRRRLRADVMQIYGDTVDTLEQGASGVRVGFRSGKSSNFDLVIGADGLFSNTRRLAFDPSEVEFKSLGVGLAVFTMPNVLGLEYWQTAHRDGRGGFLVYTARGNSELRIALGFDLKPGDEGRLAVDEQKQRVAARCAHMKWEVPRFIEAMWAAPDFYFGPVAQIRMSHWSRGRIALVGDAAYCPSPFSGQGTSLAIVGAYVLAAELARGVDNHGASFDRYQARMKSYVALNQALANSGQDGPEAEKSLDVAKHAIALDAG